MSGSIGAGTGPNLSSVSGMTSVSFARIPAWVDTTPGGFQIVSQGHWDPNGEFLEEMHPFGSQKLAVLYDRYDDTLEATRVDSATARRFDAFRERWFNGGAITEDSPQIYPERPSFLEKAGPAVGMAAGVGVLAGLLSGLATKRVAVGGVVGALAGIGAGTAMYRAIVSSADSKTDATRREFRREYAELVADPAIAKLVAAEEEIFRTERDPALEGTVDEKASLLAPAIVERLDTDGDGKVSVGDGRESSVLDYSFSLERADTDGDGFVQRDELKQHLVTQESYALDDDDTFLASEWWDGDGDGLIDPGSKHESNVGSRDGTTAIFHEYTALEDD